MSELVESVLRPISENSPQEVLQRSLVIAPQNGLGITERIAGARLSLPLCRAVAWFGAQLGMAAEHHREILDRLSPG